MFGRTGASVAAALCSDDGQCRASRAALEGVCGGGGCGAAHPSSLCRGWGAVESLTSWGAVRRTSHILVDFYHLSEYLGTAARAIANQGAQRWLWQQQERMKANRCAEVLVELARHREAESVADVSAPVRRCERYIQARLEYLDYAGALERGLPIGSGEIESGHRSVLQARLKLSGAWWRAENAEKMLALRVTRANGEWQSYWKQLRQAQA